MTGTSNTERDLAQMLCADASDIANKRRGGWSVKKVSCLTLVLDECLRGPFVDWCGEVQRGAERAGGTRRGDRQ